MTKTCFILSSLGHEGSVTRTLSNQKLYHIFLPVLSELNYETLRADQITSPGSISTQIISQLINSDLVIADVSDENPNVLYELGVRNTINKPVILIGRKDQLLPFDIGDTRALLVDMNLVDSWEENKINLKKMIVASENNPAKASKSAISSFTDLIKSFEKTEEKESNDEISNQVILEVLKEMKMDIEQLKNSHYDKKTSDTKTSVAEVVKTGQLKIEKVGGNVYFSNDKQTVYNFNYLINELIEEIENENKLSDDEKENLKKKFGILGKVVTEIKEYGKEIGPKLVTEGVKGFFSSNPM